MPVPARRRANATGRRRRSHDALKKVVSSTCSNCSAPVKPHTACLGCGFYRGRVAVNVGGSTKTIVKKAQKKK